MLIHFLDGRLYEGHSILNNLITLGLSMKEKGTFAESKARNSWQCIAIALF